MKRNQKISIVVIAILLAYALFWLFNYRRLTNGYRLPRASQEDIRELIKQTERNMVFVEGGTFRMGEVGQIEDDEIKYSYSKKDARPAHKVIVKSFSIAKFEVTFAEYDLYTDHKKLKPVLMKKPHRKERQDNYPATVNWYEARDYCEWLAAQTGKPYGLPTEAQWEYVARIRGKDNFYYSTDNGWLNFERNIVNRDSKKLVPVGTFPPNSMGVHEMTGNVAEWVSDWYDANYYANSPVDNPKGPENGSMKSLRGGSGYMVLGGHSVFYRWKMPPEAVSRIAYREPEILDIGFRCVRNEK